MTVDAPSRARELSAELEQMADRTGPNGSVSADALQLLVDSGLYGLMVPREVGGRELDLVELVEVYEQVSRADGSTGWVHFASDLTAAYFGAFLPERGAAEVFAHGVPLMAGQFAPNGTATPLLDADAPTWVVQGDYQFGSGITLASWAGGGVLAAATDSDQPDYLFACFPADEVELQGNWDVLGLRATASYDYRVDSAEVPAWRTFDFFAPVVHRGGSMYELGILGLAAAGHAGWALGVTRRVLDELIAAAGTVRMGAASALSDSDHFLITLAELESRLRAGRAWVREVLAEAQATAAAHGGVDAATVNLVRQACVHVNRGGARIAEEAYLLAGTRALRDGPLQRAYRDLHAGSQHYFASHAASIDLARDLLEQRRPT